MNLWMTEYATKDLALSVQVKKTLYNGESNFQKIAVVESIPYGRMLVLDGVFQTSTVEEFIYHEMISHVPLLTHPNPKNVLIIGGGDGGTAREAVRHNTVERVTMVEIDGMVVEVAKKYLPEIAQALILPHAKLDLQIADGIKHVKESSDFYDVIIVDCSDPIGPGEGLFNKEFYKNALQALKPDGIFVQQTESPFLHQPLIKRVWKDLSSLFPITRLYLAPIPIYPGGMHCFTMASKQYDPFSQMPRALEGETMRYFNKEIYKSCFALPEFIKNMLVEA